MSRIQASLHDLSLAEKKLKIADGEIDDVVNHLQKCLADMEKDWKGCSANEFKVLMSSFIVSMKQIQVSVKEFENYASQFYVQVHELDEMIYKHFILF